MYDNGNVALYSGYDVETRDTHKNVTWSYHATLLKTVKIKIWYPPPKKFSIRLYHETFSKSLFTLFYRFKRLTSLYLVYIQPA